MNFRYDRSIETYEKNIYIKKYRLQESIKCGTLYNMSIFIKLE